MSNNFPTHLSPKSASQLQNMGGEKIKNLFLEKTKLILDRSSSNHQHLEFLQLTEPSQRGSLEAVTGFQTHKTLPCQELRHRLPSLARADVTPGAGDSYCTPKYLNKLAIRLLFPAPLMLYLFSTIARTRKSD